ncbi:cyclic nucleotide-binding domain-containing protein [Kaarinaea lacus]
MIESLAFTAFLMGIISACSLPLGAITASYWQPNDRISGALVSFGGGALLAALTIDLVAPAFGKGHFFAVAAGCLFGGLMFFILNELVNNHGGFLRKVSTTIHHLRRHAHRRFKQILLHLGRIDIFQDLSTEELEDIATLIVSREYEAGSFFYHLGDPPDTLYIVADGQVQLLDPQNNMRAFETLVKNDAFGRMAILSGKPHATIAIAHTDVTVWELSRSDLNNLFPSSPTLIFAIQRWLQSDEVLTYLQQRQGLNSREAHNWSISALDNLQQHSSLPPISGIKSNETGFCKKVNDIRRAPILKELSEKCSAAIASQLIYKNYKRGESFFQKGDHAERMYIIDKGGVSLLDPDALPKKTMLLTDNDAFGGLSFFTGARHSTSAVATQDTSVWVLRKQEFNRLMKNNIDLDNAVKTYIQQQQIVAYLEEKQHLDPDKTMRWIKLATKNIDTGRLIPAADEMVPRITVNKGAPIAIWLGIMLDGIPESLVIGASLLHYDISLALLAGLFLSNYPEALFSSIGMRQQGLRFSRILIMWTSIMLFTGIGAALGNTFFVGTGDLEIAVVQGLAAGAMLTMIAQTMLPEAYIKGGSVVGLATLMGFLTALLFKSFA